MENLVIYYSKAKGTYSLNQDLTDPTIVSVNIDFDLDVNKRFIYVRNDWYVLNIGSGYNTTFETNYRDRFNHIVKQSFVSHFVNWSKRVEQIELTELSELMKDVVYDYMKAVTQSDDFSNIDYFPFGMDAFIFSDFELENRQILFRHIVTPKNNRMTKYHVILNAPYDELLSLEFDGCLAIGLHNAEFDLVSVLPVSNLCHRELMMGGSSWYLK